jgi:hypothetical protein
MQILGFKDLLLTPVYLIFIYAFAFIYREQFIRNKNLKKYFIPALTLKIIGAIALGLIYQYYYGGGDTSNYFYDIKIIYDLVFTDFSTAIRLTFLDTESPPYDLLPHIHRMIFSRDESSYVVVRIGSLFSFFTFGTYTPIGLFFAGISFIGIWSLFVTLTKLYPHLTKKMAFAVFFLPSVFFWGSGLMKDSLTIAALSFAFYAFFKIFIEKKNIIFNIILLIVSFYIIKSIKIYIALCFIPALFIYAFVLFSHKIKSKSLRIFIRPFLIVFGVSIGYFAGSAVVEEDKKYNLDNIAKTAKITADYINMVSIKDGGSAYSLGNYDPTITGMLSKLPQAIWVTLFRPYLWESKNPVMLLSAIECFYFLFITLIALYKLGLGNFYAAIKQNPYVQFALIFSLTFSFAVGISSYNFGTLVRYKIPMMPFYLSSIYIILDYHKKKRVKINHTN